jgi:GR25 family glycosyltransferase involved in LPS biosynthesis|tara:strand:- start:2579 stop:3229 length:651 start_codon:yes stop_codon:yes gene_type:complete
MQNKNTFKFFIIHYKKLTERKRYLDIYFKQNGFNHEYIDNIDRDKLSESDSNRFSKDKINIAIFLSHIDAYKKIVNEDTEYSLVLEDDSIPKPIFKKSINKYLKKLPADFDMFFVSPGKNNFNIPFFKKNPFTQVHMKKNIQTTWGGHGASRNADAYFISKKCANLLINEYMDAKIINEPIDWWMNSMIDKLNLKVYWAQPTLINTNLYETSFNIK